MVKKRSVRVTSANRQQRVQRAKAIGNYIVQKRSIVPNFITMANMTMGFFAIIFASRGDSRSLALAGIMVFVGSLCDAVDGAVARAMHVESPVGIQLDSLADGIAYGIAPAVIAYQAYLSKLPDSGVFPIDTGMMVAIIYPVCAIYRLARFNIGAAEDNHLNFKGLPSPPAGILIAAVPGMEYSWLPLPYFGHVEVHFPLEVFVPLYIIIAFLMVSHVDYNKLFTVLYRKGKLVRITTILAVILLLGFFRMWAVFAVTAVYITVGLVIYTIRLTKKSPRRKNGTATT